MNILYLVRHGENWANITQEFSYRKVDYSLTAKGVIQAQQTAEFFRDKAIHEIYSSPLKRARETAEIIAQALNLDVTIVELLREINVGALEGQAPNAENWAYHDRIIEDWYERRHDSAFRDGEDYWTLLARTQRGLAQILDGKSGRNIVVVGHGGMFSFTIKDLPRCRSAPVAADRQAELCDHRDRGALARRRAGDAVAQLGRLRAPVRRPNQCQP